MAQQWKGTAMNRIAKALSVVIAAEILITGYFGWQKTQRVEPPLPDFGKVDSETTEGLLDLREKARDGDSVAWRNLAEGYLGNGYYSAAEQCFRQAHTLDPTDLRSAYGHGFCLERTGRTSDAIVALTKIAEDPETDAELSWTCWYQVGRCHLREEHPEEAEQAFRKIPEFAPAVYQLCKLLIRTDRAQESLALIEQQQELYPNDVKFLQLRGKAAAALGDTKTAAEMRDREDRAEYVVEMEYGTKFIGSLGSRFGLGSRLSRAVTLKEEGTPDEQSAALSAALGIIRKHKFWSYRSVFVAMAELLVETNQPEKAIATIEEIRQFSQDGPELLLLEGKALLSEGKKAEAEAVWRRAHRMKPTVENIEALAMVVEDPDQLRLLQAEKVFRLGLAEFTRNRTSESLAYLEKAVELDPGNATYLFYLSDACRLTEQPEKASAGFRKCLELTPEHGRARRHQAMMIE